MERGDLVTELEGRIAGLEAELDALREHVDVQAVSASGLVDILLRDNARRREVEEELRLAQAWIGLAQEAAGVAAYSVDLTDGVLVWSPSTYALYGWTDAGKRPSVEAWLASVHPEDRENVRAVADAAMSLGRAVRHEFRILLPDGQVRWLSDRAKVTTDAQGRPQRVYGLNIDITDLKAAQAALEDSEEQLRFTFEHAAVGMAHVAPDGTFLRVNRRLCDFLGYPAEQLVGRTFQELTHPDDLVPDLAQLGRLARCEVDSFTMEKRYLRKNGEVVWADLNVSARRDAAGRPLHYISAITDIQARKTAEERFRRAAEAANLGVYEYNVTTGQVHWSREMYQLIGLPVDRPVEPYDLLPVLHPDDRDWVGARLSRTGPGRATAEEVEFRVVRPDGEVRWLCDRGFREDIVLEDGRQVTMLRGTVIDITERRQAAEGLRAAHDTFRRLVEQSPFGIYVVDADFRLVVVSAGAQKVFENVRPLIGRDFADVLRTIWPEPFAAEAIGRFRHTLATGEAYRAPRTVEQRNDVDAVEAYDWMIERIDLPDGRPGVVCHFYDLSERERHERQVQELIGEVNHRAKNMLAVVQAIARRTVAGDPEDFRRRFDERITALAASQDLLVQGGWRSVSLDELVRSQLAHFADLVGTRITLTGAPLRVSAGAAQTLGMALHELATNAGKYGALSNAAGRLQIDWALHEGAGEFEIGWEEREGPPATPPKRTGFGSTVIERMVKTGLGAQVEMGYAPEGFSWRIRCPTRRVLDESASD